MGEHIAAQEKRTPAARVADDLTTVVSEAENHGSLPQLKSVAIYFDEVELRTIIHALRYVEAADRRMRQVSPEQAAIDVAGERKAAEDRARYESGDNLPKDGFINDYD